LAVPLEMAAELSLAQEMGTLHLALRSEHDVATADVAAVTVRELIRTANPALYSQLSDDAKVVPVGASEEEPAMPSQIAVRTLRGAMRSTIVMRASSASGSVYSEGQGDPAQ
jgi:hypothetical protein